MADSAWGDARVVVYAFIADALTADALWHAALDDATRLALLQRLARTVARHHDAGLLQTDPHFDNFLVREDILYTLDAAAINVREAPVDPTAALDNLALLCAQAPNEYDDHAQDVLHTYAAARTSADASRRFDAPDVHRAFGTLVAKKRRTRERDYLRKIFRTASAFVAQRRFGLYRVYARADCDAAMMPVLENPDRALAEARLLKDGQTATVGLISPDGRALVIKRYNIKGPLHALRRAVQPTRAARSWRNAHLLRFHELPTPRPVALIERRFGPLRRKSWLITEYTPGESLLTFLQRTDIDPARKRTVATRVMHALRRMARVHISHGDLKATNILIENDQPTFIDLDSVRRHHRADAAARAWRRDVRRFMRNWEDKPALRALFAGLDDATPATDVGT